MKSNFKIGQRVGLLDDALEGVIKSMNDHELIIETQDGFEFNIASAEAVILEDIEINEIPMEVLMEKIPKARKKPVPKRKKGEAPPMEVDLHINQLIRNPRGMNNHDMLTLQVDTARRQLEFAIKKRIQKVVFIHGVGEGVLRAELEYLFSRYENVRYYDADYQKYGQGATEIYIMQNP